ncbi:MAG: hypothetical protein A4E28_01647 [Methanocella sp. PtaU1.Bin125]|nr:MAG: hypothetical protein A4E28_01647 [Methanocella sp. PtaU1.Bin125]
MARKDDLPDMIVSAARYAFSNMTALLIGGIVIALSFLIIGLPFFLGYITRCMKEIVRGNGVMPEWDDIGQMFVDGIRMTGVFFVYVALFIAVITIPVVTLAIFNFIGAPMMILLSTLLLAITSAIVFCLLAVAFFASWIVYASTGSMRKAITVKMVWGFIVSDPTNYLVALVACSVVALLGVVAMSLFVTIPWALFVMCSAVTFIYAKFYQDTMKSTAHALDWLK